MEAESRLLFFFFNDTATTEIYTLSLHDALPICSSRRMRWRASAVRSASRAMSRRSKSRRRCRPCLPRASIERRNRSEEHTSELQSQSNLVCRLLLEKKKIVRKLQGLNQDR